MFSNGGWASLVAHVCTYTHILEQTSIYSLLSYIISLNIDIHFAGWLFFTSQAREEETETQKE